MKATGLWRGPPTSGWFVTQSGTLRRNTPRERDGLPDRAKRNKAVSGFPSARVGGLPGIRVGVWVKGSPLRTRDAHQGVFMHRSFQPNFHTPIPRLLAVGVS